MVVEVYIVFILSIYLATLMNAFMDRTENIIAFNQSIFYKKNNKFWCKTISAHHVGFLPLTKYRPDSWHIAKTLMWFFLGISTVFYQPVFVVTKYSILNALMDVLVFYGALLTLFFNLNFNHLLKRKKH